MSFTSVVHDLLESEARLAPTEAGELHLEETEPSASLKKVIIQLPKHLPAASFDSISRFSATRVNLRHASPKS